MGVFFVSENNEDFHTIIGSWTDDGEFLYGTRKTLDYLINHGVTVYQYIFSYVGEQNTGCQFGHCGLGVCHGEELQYIWKSEPKQGKGLGMFHIWTAYDYIDFILMYFYVLSG